MRLATYHAHTVLCDGRDTAEAMIRAAIDAGMTDIGFSAHTAWPFAAEWHLPPGEYGAYAAEVRGLAGAYAGKIRVYRGFEADYLPGMSAPDRGIYARFSPDYLIGSVHYAGTDDPRRACEPWTVDGPTEDVAATLQRCFDGDGRRAVTRYFELLREMAATCAFDIVGHADLPRKRNGALKFFDESSPWYRSELVRTADALAAAGKIVEINTGGISRGAMDDVYPSEEFLALLAERGVRITVNSDAHATGDLTAAYDRAYDAARRAGIRELWFLDPQGWVSEPI